MNPRRTRLWLSIVVAVLVVAAGVVWIVRPTRPSDAVAGPIGGLTTSGDPATGTASASAPAPTVTPTHTPTVTPRTSASTAHSQPAPPAKAGSKKGVSTWDFTGVGPALTDVRASWYYNWAAGPTANAGTSASFVPMIWGSGSVTAANLSRAKAAGTTILGFNEPDHSEQANLSPTAALDLWPQLQATGRRLGSPAVASGGADPGGWLDQFMTGARQRGYRVDFITVHWYGSDFSSAAVEQLQGYLKAVHDRYHLPIWLTEFALIKFTGSGSVYPTAAQQVAFIQGAAKMLNSLSYVERYAWFALPTGKDQDQTGLYRDGHTPTSMGIAYRALP